jgi:hypothetical protein
MGKAWWAPGGETAGGSGHAPHSSEPQVLAIRKTVLGTLKIKRYLGIVS